MITKFKLFEINEGIVSDHMVRDLEEWAEPAEKEVQLPFEVKHKSNITWFKNHNKIWTQEEENELIKEIIKNKNQKEDFDKAPKNVDLDPYGEEEWRDDFIYQQPFFKSSTNKMLSILIERLKLLRSFRKANEGILNEKFLPNWFKRLILLGVVALVSCSGPRFDYKGKAVVISYHKSSNILTPKIITVQTKEGTVFDLKVKTPNVSTRVPFEVEKGDTLFLNIKKGTPSGTESYVSKIENDEVVLSTDLSDAERYTIKDTNNW